MANLSQAEIDALLSGGDIGGGNAAPEQETGGAGYRSAPGPEADVPGYAETSDFDELEYKLRALDKSAEYLTEGEKDILGEIGNICMGASATTMYALLGHRVTITTPRVRVYTSEEMLSVYHSPFVLVKVEYKRGVTGKNLLLLKERDSILITDLLMGREPSNGSAEIDEMHLSAMSEIMNQMIGSSATSLSHMLGIPIDITPPEALWVNRDTDLSPFLDGSQIAIEVSFDMEIEGILKSELMQIMTIETGKELTAMVTEGHQPELRTLRGWDGARDISSDADSRAAAAPAPAREKTDDKKEAMNTVNIKPMNYDSFDEQTPEPPTPLKNAAIDLVGDIPLQVAVELGKTRKSINDILGMGIGSVIVLDKMAGELVEVIVNGKRIARGEVVVIDENYGVRITDIITKDETA